MASPKMAVRDSYTKVQACCWLSICLFTLSRVECKQWRPNARLCLVLPETYSTTTMQIRFETFLKDSVSSETASPMELDAVTLIWRRKNRSLLEVLSRIQNLVDLNVTAVISFLPAEQNQLLLLLLSDELIPVIGIANEDPRWKGGIALEQRMYASIQASEALQATLVKDLLMEHEHNRLICITTNAARRDMFWRQFFRYVRNTAEPHCIIIPEVHATAVERVYTTLAAIATSGVKIIVVHSTPQESKKILFAVQELNLKHLPDDFVWIFSDQAMENDARTLPDGAIGISRLPRSEETHNQRPTMEETLLHDAVRVFTKALATATLKGESTHTGQFTAFKRQLYREILRGSFEGDTGPIEFNTDGERVTFRFTISKVVKSLEQGPHWHRIGSSVARWDQHASSPVFETFLPRDLPRPRHLRIVAIEHEPFTMARPVVQSSRMGVSCPANSVLCSKQFMNSTLDFNYTQPHSLLCCYGAVIDMLLTMQHQTGFTFTMTLVKDGKYGSYDPEKRKMDGIIGDLVRGKADLAVGLVTITEERSKFVDFTIPYREVSLAFLVKSNRRRKNSFAESIGDMRLMKPFGAELWLACVATFIVVALTVYMMEKFTRYRNIKSSLLLPFEFAAYVFGNIFHVPLTHISARTFAVPVVMVVANCGALVLVSSYTANLLLSLIVLEDTSIVSGLFDVKLISPPDGFTFGVVRDSSAEDFFKKSSNPKLRQIYSNMKNVDSVSEGMRKIQSGELTAFITESGPFMTRESCQFKLDGNPIDLVGLAFALPKNSQWTSEFSRAIHKLNSLDKIEGIFDKWRRAGCESRDQSIPNAFSMGLDEFGGFLFNTFVICFGCFFILSLEILIHRKVTRNHNHFNFWKGTSLQKIHEVVRKPQSRASTTTIVPD